MEINRNIWVFPAVLKQCTNHIYQCKTVALQLLGSTLIIFSLSGCKISGDFGSLPHVPVLLSLEELRQPIALEESRPIKVNGKIVVYGQYLLINEPEKGIHLYDNLDPANPLPVGFIPIPGNTDVVVKDGLLYANNYIDLVVINISDVNDIKTDHRVLDVFRPKYSLWRHGLEPGSGVIIDLIFEQGESNE